MVGRPAPSNPAIRKRSVSSPSLLRAWGRREAIAVGCFAILGAVAELAAAHDPALHGAPAAAPSQPAVEAPLPPGIRALTSPATPGSRSARFNQLASVPSGTVAPGARWRLTWLEPGGPGAAWRLRTAALEGQAFGPPVTIAEGHDLLVNGADTPLLAAAPDASLVAVFPRNLPEGGYGIELARSVDDGATWKRLGWAHDDTSAVEHGFASLVPDGDALRLVWLDGRDQPRSGNTALRTGLLRGERVEPGGVLDDRVCDCCATAAAAGPGGPLVFYRDRDAAEVRDVAVAVPISSAVWRRSSVHLDGWTVAGCPVNGPAAAAFGDRVWTAWFTAAAPGAAPRATSAAETADKGAPGATSGPPTRDSAPRVLVATSSDGGHNFAPPEQLSTGTALGRVALVADGAGGAWAAWVEANTEPAAPAAARATRVGAEIWLAHLAADGKISQPRRGPEVAAGLAAGTPQLAFAGNSLTLAWVDIHDQGGVKVAAVVGHPAPARE